MPGASSNFFRERRVPRLFQTPQHVLLKDDIPLCTNCDADGGDSRAFAASRGEAAIAGEELGGGGPEEAVISEGAGEVGCMRHLGAGGIKGFHEGNLLNVNVNLRQSQQRSPHREFLRCSFQLF